MSWNKPYCFPAWSTATLGGAIVLEHSGMEHFTPLLPHQHFLTLYSPSIYKNTHLRIHATLSSIVLSCSIP